MTTETCPHCGAPDRVAAREQLAEMEEKYNTTELWRRKYKNRATGLDMTLAAERRATTVLIYVLGRFTGQENAEKLADQARYGQ